MQQVRKISRKVLLLSTFLLFIILSLLIWHLSGQIQVNYTTEYVRYKPCEQGKYNNLYPYLAKYEGKETLRDKIRYLIPGQIR